MALENEQHDLQQAMTAFRDGLQGGGTSLKDMDKAIASAQTGIKAFGKALVTAVPLEFAQGLGNMSKQLASGDAGLKTFNTVIDTASGAAQALAKTIPFVGEALAGIAKAAADASKFLVDQLDATSKSFNAVGASGALTAKGMTGLRDQFTTAGLSLQVWQKQIQENSETMAQFRGLAGDGAEDFSKIVGGLTQDTDGLGMDLRRLGMSADQIASTAGAFVKQQTTLGRAQNMSNEELRRGTVEYAKELDLISKVTGQNREAIQKQQDAALSESRFRAVYEEMMANNQGQAAKALMGFQTVISGLDKEAGQGLRDMASGIVDSAAAQKLYNSTGGKALDIIERLKDGQIDQAQAQIELKNAVGDNIVRMREQARYNKDANETQLQLAGSQKIAQAQFDKNNNVMKTAEQVQKEQTDGSDDLTDATVKAQKSLEKLATLTSKLATEALGPMATAVENTTEAMVKMFEWARDTLGAKAAPPPKTERYGGSAGGRMGSSPGGGATVVGGAGGEGDSGSIMEAAGTGPVRMNQADIKKMGLKIKEGDVQAENGAISPSLIELAKKIQAEVPGFAYFSGFNDNYHQEKASGSEHVKGLALDFALDHTPSKEEAAKLSTMLTGMGASYVNDEYNGTSKNKTAGHMHAAVSAADGAVLSGPTSGYRPNLTMHGTEAVVPLNSPAAQQMGIVNDSGGGEIMIAQLAKLDEIVSVMKNQLTVSSKLLQMQS
jgi:hypothetical protein